LGFDIIDLTNIFNPRATSKFKLLVSYADHVVGVCEHSIGGHSWAKALTNQSFGNVIEDETATLNT
jgi:hypothetical protein